MEADPHTQVRSWYGSPLLRQCVYSFLFAYVAFMFAGFFLTAASRFDEDHINEMIVDGVVITQVNDDVVLGFKCNGQLGGYAYNVGSGSLTYHPISQAEFLFASSNSISDLFPVSQEQLVAAATLVGGSVGMASMLERVRIASVERKYDRLRGGSISVEGTRKSKNKAYAAVMAAASTAAGLVSGYLLGEYIAKALKLDDDCTSAKLHAKLMLPATWRSVLGTVLAHGFTSLLDCIKASQVRTVFRAGVIDYQHAPLSLEIGRRLSDVDDTLIKRLAEDPTRPCGPETSGITVVWPDGSKHTPVFTDRNIANPGCWTDEDVAIALEERRRGAVYTATDQAEAAQRLIGREFYSSSAGLIGNDMRPTAADALAKAMERIAKGRLVNEKGEATIGVDDIKVLLDMKERCPGSE